MSQKTFSTNNRITMKKILFITAIALLIGILSLPIYAGTISASGNLTKTVTTTENTPAVQVTDCNGNVLRTIPSSAITTTEYKPYSKSGQTVRFVVIRKENPAVTVATFNENINGPTLSYNASDGAYSIDLTDPNITPSRYNYSVKIYISEDSYASVISEREYTLASSGGAFPIGSIIAYVGNSITVASLEESGWFKCAGQSIDGLSALSADERTALKNILGNSSNLPDLRGNFLRGLDEGRGWDDDAASRTGGESTTGVRSYQPTQIQSHNHTGTANADGNHNHGGTTGSASRNFAHETQGGISGGGSATLANNSYADHNHSIPWSGTHTHSLTINNEGGAETRPENIAVYWLIRGR